MLATEELAGRDEAPLHSNPVREAGLHGAHERGRERGALPQVVVVGLGDGGPETALELGLEGCDLLALALQAPVVRKVQLDLE
jgi:hypothetical protein